MDFEFAIIGSGPAGTHAAYGLKGKKVLMIDAGMQAKEWQYDSVENIKEQNPSSARFLLGQKFESLNNIENKYLSPKLKSPYLRYVTEAPSFFELKPKQNESFTTSFSQGGLANAWGGGVYRFSDQELSSFPYDLKELAPYYDTLNELIGIQGEQDDVAAFCGNEPELLSPFSLTPISQNLLSQYTKKREKLNSLGIYFGRQRLALLSKEYKSRKAYQFLGDDFFAPRLTGLYSPYYTLQQLIKDGSISYEGGWVAEFFEETEAGVKIFCRSINGSETKIFTTKKLLIGAGAVNTTSIVLRSHKDYTTKLPIIENPISFLPILSLSTLGTIPNHKNRVGAELLVCHRNDIQKDVTFSSFYGFHGPLKSDFWSELPFTIKGRLTAINYLLPAMGVLQIFHKGYVSERNYLKLTENNTLLVAFEDYRIDKDVEHKIAKNLLRLGFITHPKLAKSPVPGSSIHYAGPLGMSREPNGKYSSDKYGRLRSNKNVYIIDSAAFPTLPSKNLTYTIMAHALRVANKLAGEIT